MPPPTHRPTVLDESQYGDLVHDLFEDFEFNAQDLGMEMLLDARWTAVFLHKEYTRNGEDWLGDGGIVTTNGGNISFMHYYTRCSDLNLIDMAILYVQDEDMYNMWKDTMHLARRNDAHASVQAELRKLIEASRTFKMAAGEYRRRCNIADDDRLDTISYDMCRVYTIRDGAMT